MAAAPAARHDRAMSTLSLAPAGARPPSIAARSPREVATSLVDVEATLRSLDRTCLAAAAALLPSTEPDDICTRYRAAGDLWRAAGSPPPSYERQAQILASLHDAGATLRAAAECCERARRLLEATCVGAER
jgi:hypothetical protein